MKENPRFKKESTPDVQEGQGTISQTERSRTRPLNFREFLGLFYGEQPLRREGDSRPSSSLIREYLSMHPSIDDVVDLSKQATKGLKQVWGKASRKTS